MKKRKGIITQYSGQWRRQGTGPGREHCMRSQTCGITQEFTKLFLYQTHIL